MSTSPPTPAIGGAPSAAHNKVVHELPLERPAFRRLKAYAFDPSLSQQLAHAAINEVTLKVPWEYDPKTGKDILTVGPVGEYLEVVDCDPASGCFYLPVDLNKPYLLANNGLSPAEGNPQFHQQMAYAVAMTTIMHFEHALGRRALWSPHRPEPAAPGDPCASQAGVAHQEWAYVPRLRIYPHGLREANAYYSPEKKALLFGYFPAYVGDVRSHLPSGMVFTCLSHDVVAHETTHALLDGMHRRFIEPTNPDVLAFHEAFADIVALFQHFSYTEVLCSQVAQTRGDLATENLLGQLAQEFGQATGLRGALRDALGGVNPQTNRWEPAVPDPTLIQTVIEPHARGSLLVAAIFRAFVAIYRMRSADLLRIATAGTGVLPAGELHPDLVNRLAAEAAKAAKHILNMCIRALDYCPPVDLTFGDYLRALITADYDLVRDDDLGYRLAVVEAFREYGIYPHDVRSLSVDSLLWQPSDPLSRHEPVLPGIAKMRQLIEPLALGADRAALHAQQEAACAMLHERLRQRVAELSGLGLNVDRLLRPDGQVSFEVHSVRPARRVGPDGQTLTDLVIEITQWRRGYFDPAIQDRADKADREKVVDPSLPPCDFRFRGGTTLLVEMHTGEVRYAVVKNVMSATRLAQQRAFRSGQAATSLRATYFSGLQEGKKEPFAFLHRFAAGEVSA
ncbi:MAG TPA: hypothetical protein VGA61_17730 [Anaerolineae bacterium]